MMDKHAPGISIFEANIFYEQKVRYVETILAVKQERIKAVDKLDRFPRALEHSIHAPGKADLHKWLIACSRHENPISCIVSPPGLFSTTL